MPSNSASPGADPPRSPPVTPEAEPEARLSGTSGNEADPAGSRFAAPLGDGSLRPYRDDGWWPLAQRRARVALRVTAVVSSILHAGVVLTLVGWIERTDVGAVPQPTEAVSVELVASQTLEALQPKPASEPAPAPEATAPVEGKSEASEAPVEKAAPDPEPVEPPPEPSPDAAETESRAAKAGDTRANDAPAAPEPAESPTPTEAVPAPPQAKVAEDEPPAKRKQRRTIERKAAERAPKGGVTSKSQAGKGTGGQRASASSGSILNYAAQVRARVAANKPSGGGLRGTPVVAFGLTPSGGLAFASLARSSGNATLDRLALAAVRGAAPFPTPPAGATSAQLRFSIPFYFE
jgi:periplasmic protein TonB